MKLASWSDVCDDRKDVDFEDLEPESSGGELTEATVIIAIGVISLQVTPVLGAGTDVPPSR